MIRWDRNKHEINNGYEFEPGDDANVEQINGTINNSLYAVDVADGLTETPEVENENSEKNPTVEFSPYEKSIHGVIKTFYKFKFKNIKGQKGDKGLPLYFYSEIIPEGIGADTKNIPFEKISAPDNVEPVVGAYLLSLVNGNMSKILSVDYVNRTVSLYASNYNIAGQSIYLTRYAINPTTTTINTIGVNNPNKGKLKKGDLILSEMTGGFVILTSGSSGGTATCEYIGNFGGYSFQSSSEIFLKGTNTYSKNLVNANGEDLRVNDTIIGQNGFLVNVDSVEQNVYTATFIVDLNISLGTNSYHEKTLNLTITNAGKYYFYGCSGTVNATGTGAKTLYLIGCPSLTVNNNGSAKTYRDGFPVGGIFQTTGEDSPAEMFGGNWEKITADAYLKIVMSGAGILGGTSSEHNIPIESMPPHRHALSIAIAPGDGSRLCGTSNSQVYKSSYAMSETGGGKPYYPYYYGIYAWRRINVSGQE